VTLIMRILGTLGLGETTCALLKFLSSVQMQGGT